MEIATKKLKKNLKIFKNCESSRSFRGKISRLF